MLKVLLFLRGLGAATATATAASSPRRTFPLIILLSRIRNQSCVDWIQARVEMLLSVQWMDNLPSVYDGCCAAQLLTQGSAGLQRL